MSLSGSQRLEFLFNQTHTQRLDKFLVDCLPELSRSRIQNFIKDSCVYVDGVSVKKTGFSLDHPCRIEVEIPTVSALSFQPESIPLLIVFENKDVLVINKPADMVVHPSAGHTSGTLVNAVQGYSSFPSDLQSSMRYGMVHRLDKNTSGLIVFAKNEKSQLILQNQFSNRSVEKIYLALVDSHPPTPSGRIEAPIYRDPFHRQKMGIAPLQKGRAAVTEYSTLKKFKDYTYLRVKPLTGRTHQIRVHLASIGCPVAGDTIYGHKNSSIPLERQFLHAYQLKITLPGEQHPRIFQAELPEELNNVLKILKPI